MNQNVTLSFGLSLLTLVFFTVVLRPVDPTRDPSPMPVSPGKVEEATSISKTEAEPKPPELPVKKADPFQQRPEPAEEAAKPETGSEPPSTSPTISAQQPRALMTPVIEGETLEAFAKRVYGPEGDPVAVWKSNRDLLNNPQDPIVPGTILRTP